MKLLPPIVVGPVVMVIGLSLAGYSSEYGDEQAVRMVSIALHTFQ